MTKELRVINPYTEETALTLPMLAPGDVDRVVSSARKAFEGWTFKGGPADA